MSNVERRVPARFYVPRSTFRVPNSTFRILRSTFHGQLGLQAQQIAGNRGQGKGAVAALVADRALPLEGAVNLDAVPLFCVTDVVDRDLVVLTPEERDRLEPYAVAEHVPGRRLALTLGHNPMFDTDAIT